MKQLLLLFVLSAIATKASDFDHNGTEERLVTRDGKIDLESFEPSSKTWKLADFQLPSEVTSTDSLKFIDLNDDGFEDLLFSNETYFHIALWSTHVRPELGWTKGWSQPVRSAKRSGAANEPPPLFGADVEIRESPVKREAPFP